jgi:site-specific recombinase XerC
MFPSRKRKGAGFYSVLSFSLPKLYTKKEWYVGFYCVDPVDGKKKLKRYMLNRIPSVSDRRLRATELIAILTKRLYEGWNPWVEDLTERKQTKFDEICDMYNIFLRKLVEKNIMKQKTYYDYQSRMKMLLEYNNSRAKPILLIYQFDAAYLSDFLDYLLLDRDVSARTRNNYRTWLSAFSSWLMEKKYIDANPAESIRVMAEQDKFRSALSAEELKKLRDFLKEVNKDFLLACMMEYYTFIRPDELTHIKIGDISITDQKVFVSSTISKNRRDGMVGLNDSLLKLMIDLGVFEKPSHYYLFGKEFKPSEEKADSRIFRDYFFKIRALLRWPMNYQFYSLKDSGIRDLANAEGIVIARDQARHTDISTTNKYLKRDALLVHDETKHFEGSF